jgi:hypothetical protein
LALLVQQFRSGIFFATGEFLQQFPMATIGRNGHAFEYAKSFPPVTWIAPLMIDKPLCGVRRDSLGLACFLWRHPTTGSRDEASAANEAVSCLDPGDAPMPRQPRMHAAGCAPFHLK